jgi:hypothetical protein
MPGCEGADLGPRARLMLGTHLHAQARLHNYFPVETLARTFGLNKPINKSHSSCSPPLPVAPCYTFGLQASVSPSFEAATKL